MQKALKPICSLRSDQPKASHGWASTEGLAVVGYLLTSEGGGCPLSRRVDTDFYDEQQLKASAS